MNVKSSLSLRLCLILTAVTCSAPLAAEEPSLPQLERDFRELPMHARELTGPLFWLHGDESPDLLQQYIAKVAEGGNGSFTAESRPHNDWLGEGWYRDLGICLEAAKRHGLKMWIFDERWWPSGEVGGKVPEQYGSKWLEATATEIEGPTVFTTEDFAGPHFVAALAGQETADGFDGASLIDLADHIHDGKLTWNVPPGSWKVLKFTWTARQHGGRYLVDGASADAVDWYINTVYQPHYDRFKDEFGKTIAGFFYDEPETRGDWGTELSKIFAERGIDRKHALTAWKFKLAGEEHAAARYQYQDAFAEAWGRTLYGGITRWCEAHNVTSIGHFLEHGNEYIHSGVCAGNMFPLQKYSHMGGIDAVFRQFAWGQREVNDVPSWQTPKIGSSITHAYGKGDDVTMVEIYGARGQDISYPEMKWWADHMHVSGVNFLIPHSFNPRAPYDTDCPPYFYNGGYEPRWPLYRVLADYTSRLSVMLTGGRHVCPAAFLFLGGSAHVGQHVLPHQLSEALQDALYDCDWLPYDVFENDMRIDGRELRLHDESYKFLILPAAEVIPYATLEKAKGFFDNGGVVVGYGILPTKSATLGTTSADITKLREAIWGDPAPGLSVCNTNEVGGRSYFLPEKPTPEQLQQVLAGDAGIHPTLEVLEGETSHWLHVLHRVRSGRDVFFIVNQNHTGEPRRFRFRATADGVPECWDPLSGEITTLPYKRDGRFAEISLTLHPNESSLLVFQPKNRPLPKRLDTREDTPSRTIAINREPAPPPPPSLPESIRRTMDSILTAAWIWYPEGDPARSAPPGTRYFRKQITLPADAKITRASFLGAADNYLTLFVNGKVIGHTDNSYAGWRNLVELDVTSAMRPGMNQLAFAAVNATDNPSPAGALGRFVIELEQDGILAVRLDESWKVGRDEQPGWQNAEFDDAAWPSAKIVAQYGNQPWGAVTPGPLTLSPVVAKPYLGHFDVPVNVDLSQVRVYLEMDDLSPELAARVTVNDQDAGGFISAPLRLLVTPHLKSGRNTIRIEPFAPTSARLAIYQP